MNTVIPRSTARRIIASALAVGVVASGFVLSSAAPAVAAMPAVAAAPAVAASPGCQRVTALDNGGFETPAIPDASYTITPSSNVPGWESTDPSGIEIWSSGFQGVPSAVGRQFAELNATQAGTLFQEVATQPGQSLQWSLLHRGRGGTDVMDVLIGAPGGELVSQGNLSDDTSGWGRHTGIYLVPAGQTVTRFGFRAVSTGSGDNSIGNFLDDISFGTGACVVSTSAVANTTRPGDAVHVGDTVEYTVTAENQGGSRAILATLGSTLPAGLELVPGSLRTVAGAAGGQWTDAAGDDAAEFAASDRTVTARLGSGATATDGGALAPQEAATFVFRALITSAAALSTVSNAFTVEYTDSLSGARIVSPTPVVSTPVAATVNLSVSVTADAADAVAGSTSPVTFSVIADNAGPQTDSGVMVTVTPPAGLSDPTVTLADGTACPIATGVATCAIGDLPSNAPVRIVVSGTVGQDMAAGTPLVTTATVSGTVFDSAAADNASSATTTVSSDSDLWVRADDDTAAVRPGQNASMRFVVGNTGASAARAIVVQVEVPKGFDAEPSAGTIDADGLWSIPALASGETRSVTLRGLMTEPGRFTTAAWLVSSSTADSRAGNERAVAAVFVEAEPVTPPAPTPTDRIPDAAPSVGTDAETPANPVAAAAPAAPPAPAAAGRAATAAIASGLAVTGAHGVDAAVGFAILLLLAGIGLLVVRSRRPDARHRA